MEELMRGECTILGLKSVTDWSQFASLMRMLVTNPSAVATTTSPYSIASVLPHLSLIPSTCSTLPSVCPPPPTPRQAASHLLSLLWLTRFDTHLETATCGDEVWEEVVMRRRREVDYMSRMNPAVKSHPSTTTTSSSPPPSSPSTPPHDSTFTLDPLCVLPLFSLLFHSSDDTRRRVATALAATITPPPPLRIRSLNGKMGRMEGEGEEGEGEEEEDEVEVLKKQAGQCLTASFCLDVLFRLLICCEERDEEEWEVERKSREKEGFLVSSRSSSSSSSSHTPLVSPLPPLLRPLRPTSSIHLLHPHRHRPISLHHTQPVPRPHSPPVVPFAVSSPYEELLWVE